MFVTSNVYLNIMFLHIACGFELLHNPFKPCVSAVKLNAERAADDFHLNAHATIVYYILLSDEV